MSKHEREPGRRDRVGASRPAVAMNWPDGVPTIPPFGDPNQALFNGTGNLSPEVADPRIL